MSGFKEEFRRMREMGGSPKVTPEADASAMAAAKAKTDEALTNTPDKDDPDAQIMKQQFVHGQALEETIEEEAIKSEPPVIPPPKEEKKTKVKMNGKEFESVEEAMDYAAKLEIELEKQEAFRKGQESTKTPAEAKPAEKKKILKIAEKIFENPEAAFEELEAHFEERFTKGMEDRDNKKTQAQVQAETVKKTWDNFYKENADLAEWPDEVNIVLNREWEIVGKMKPDEGLKTVAEKARAYIASIKEKALPKQILPSKTVVSPQGGNKTTTTSKPATEKKLTFADQVRSTNRRTAAQPES